MTYSERIRNEIWSDKELQKRFNNHRHGGAIDRAIKLAYSFGKQDRDADLIKAVIESGSFQIKDLPYFNRLWAGAENGKLMPEATRKLYELEIIEKEKVLELIKGDKI